MVRRQWRDESSEPNPPSTAVPSLVCCFLMEAAIYLCRDERALFRRLKAEPHGKKEKCINFKLCMTGADSTISAAETLIIQPEAESSNFTPCHSLDSVGNS